MSNPASISLQQLFRYWRDLPHQQAAISELEAQLQQDGYKSTLRRDQPWFATWSQAGKQTHTDDWVPIAAALIKSYEGLRLSTYLDAAGVPTIGWGHTGPDVKRGLTITEAWASDLLRADMRHAATGVVSALPQWNDWPPHQQAALVSFVFNIGTNAFAASTLVRRIRNGEDRVTVVSEEMPRWNKADGKELLGLTRRRASEVALFREPPS